MQDVVVRRLEVRSSNYAGSSSCTIVIDLVMIDDDDDDDDNIDMISQEILTKKNLWKSFSRYLKEKTRENLRRRKKVLIFEKAKDCI